MGLNRIRLLYLGDAALARECLGRPGGSIEVVGAIPSHGSFDLSPFDVILIEHGHPGIDTAAILKDIAARTLRIPVILVADWDERLAVAALRLGVADYVVKSRPSFRAVYFRLNRLLAHVSDAAEFAAALDKAREDRAADAAKAAERLAQCKAELLGELCKAAANQEQLAQATHALEESEAASRRAAEQHARQYEELQRGARQAAADAAAALLDARQRGSMLETELAAARQVAERQASDMTAAAARFAKYCEETERRTTQAEVQHTAEIRALTARLEANLAALQAAAERHATVEAELARELAERQAFAQKSADAEAAARHAAQQHASEIAAAAAGFAEYREETERRTTQAEEQHKAEVRALTARLEADLAAVDTRFAQHRDESAAALQAAAQIQTSLEVELAREKEQHNSAIAGAAARFAEYREETERRTTQAEADLAQARTETQSLSTNLAALDTRFAQHRDESAVALRAAAQVQAALDSEIAGAAARFAEYREETERRTTQAAEDARQASDRHTSEIAALDARFVQHREESAAALQAAAQAAEHARQDSEQHASEMAAFDARFGQHREESAAALQNAAQRQAALEAEIAGAAARFAEYREETERRAAQAAEHAHQDSERHASEKAALEARFGQHREESAAALQNAAQRQAALEAEVAHSRTETQSVTQALADTESAARHAAERHVSELSAAAGRLEEHREEAQRRAAQASADAAAALERAEQQRAAEIRDVTDQLEAEIARASAEQKALEQALADVEAAARRSIAVADAELRRAEQHYAAEIRYMANCFEATLAAEQQAAEEAAAVRQAAFDAAVRHADEKHASEMDAAAARLEDQHEQAELRAAKAAEHAAAALERVELQFAADIHDLAGRLEASLAERRAAAQSAEREAAEYARDRAEWEAATEEWIHRLETADQAARASVARAQAADLQLRRRFDHAPMGVCCCSRDGAITAANDALTRLLGYDKPEELQRVNFAATVFASGDELQWLIDRCLTSRATESVETTWRKKDGSRLIVRLLAVATATDQVDLVAMDITTVRVLEEKLRNSQRMEAVGRLGSEIAATCHNLLKHVKQEGQRWLDQIESDKARRHGELLLEEVTRAEGFLRQLTVYGDEQKNVRDLVDVNQVLRDLEPVLKKVAGGDVDLVLPKIAGPLNLDVDGERVERMLVNVAAYGRERMRDGGRLMIEVDSVAVDRSFVAKHPNVRPGPHVLLTVTEEKGSSKRSGGTIAGALSPASPGIDLGALQALVNDCGGHLWMRAERQGQMMLKIHLPRRVLDHTESRVPPTRPGGRAGWINRRFGAQH